MDNLLNLTDKDIQERKEKEKHTPNPHITSERIEKLKKTFQPFWMRGLMPRQNENEVGLNAKNIVNQI